MKKSLILSIAVLFVALIVLPVATGCGGTTETTTAAQYDITKIVAGVKVDDKAAALVPDKYKTTAVKVGSDSPYPPWEMFVEVNGQPTEQFTGFDYDVAQAIGAKLGIKFEFIKASFDGIIIGIQAGNYDLAMSGMYDNKLRQETVDFVDYAQDGTGLLVKKGNPEGIKGFADLAGKAVGAEKGTTQAAALATLNEQFKAEGKPEMSVSEFPDQPAALLAVQSGKIVADLTDSSTAGYIAVTTDNGATFEVVMDAKPPTGWETQPDGIGVLKSNTGLRDAIQTALQGLMDDGTYKTIIGHYGIQPLDKATINAGTQPGG